MTPFPRHPPSPRELGELAQLLFEWPIRRAPRLALPICIVAAAVIQTGVVFLFSIRYETASETFRQAPVFYFLPPDSPIARRIGPWLEAHDPSVFSPLRATETAVPPPPPLTYRPSYEDPPPPLKGLPPEPEPPAEPPSLPFNGEVLRVAAATPPFLPARRPGNASTGVRWLDGLQGRTLARESDTPPPAVSSKVAVPSAYEVAVNADGIPLSCTLTQTSGDRDVDDSGRSWIVTRRFTPSDGISWGRVILVWNGVPPSALPAASSRTP
jgi:hypothetical protein